SRLRPEESDSLGPSNTEQVARLARHLGVREQDIPCLHFTLLEPRGDQTFTVPLRLIDDFSVYQFCKECTQVLGQPFEEWGDALRQGRIPFDDRDYRDRARLAEAARQDIRKKISETQTKIEEGARQEQILQTAKSTLLRQAELSGDQDRL